MSVAISFTAYGDADQLTTVEAEAPQPGPGEVQLRVRAAGVNPVDWKLRAGYLAAVMPLELPHVLGLEAAGTVTAVGAGVTRWSVGDEVFGRVPAAYAEYAVTAENALAAKPAELSWEQAGALHMAAETSTRALAALGLAKGETLLVHGAAGGVGAVAVQFAVAAGARVIGTASPANHDYLRELGAEPVEYGDEVFDRVRAVASEGVDAVLDTAGGYLAGSVALLGGGARVLSIVNPQEAEEAGASFTGSDPEADHTPAALAKVLELTAAGTFRLPLRAVLPLAEAARAHRLSEQGHGRGRIVLTV
ncbi:NADP-dependent oxidoreductase [Kitasatospora sp. NPDC006697]|uniref:NADP-dependent oxidoreductase n=1 Tax=Kitasatospora sp. NPDC006697 TaxID=3364020 RepID=UPI0036829621